MTCRILFACGLLVAAERPSGERHDRAMMQASIDSLGRVTMQRRKDVRPNGDLPKMDPVRQFVVGSTPTGSVLMGDPPVNMSVIFDTGSNQLVVKTWATVKPLLEQMHEGLDDELEPTAKLYNHEKSTTYEANTKNGTEPDVGSVHYGSGSAVTINGKEMLNIAGRILHHFPLSEIEDDSIPLLHTDERLSGVLGLQPVKSKDDGESVFSRMREMGLLTSFGYCRAPHDTGTFIWGDQDMSGQRVPVIGDVHWAVSLMDISAAGSPDDKLCTEGECVAVIDTGSNIIAGPSKLLSRLAKKIKINYDCSNVDDLPDLRLRLGPDMEVSLPGSAYVMKMTLPSFESDEDVRVEGDEHQHHPAHGEEGHLHVEGDEHHVPTQPTMDSEYTEQDQRLRRLRRGFARLAARHGVDLELALRDIPEDQLLARAGQATCVPAFVPLDVDTAHGSLWVIGTPLFEKYYARFSWPPSDERPAIFLQELSSAAACASSVDAGAAPEEPSQESANRPAPARKTSMVRREARELMVETPQPAVIQSIPERRVEEIRYPKWAQELKML